ncbi:hypothetical protein HYPSUDRAFT_987630 [Hypholoma sublateritium FD-334 SS-4]|uniref:RRN6 beta-propeller domain-containing protein n=1 Tax=Hypholoma sublateritium (strain FD-334 SS-4) TaxID=945553 RepID=A0A0D2LHL9_HYPSF|nr:hypothetical protein HYPSUDRAFT_987630 [Hypholoma sublateritium FD-334 SS-4]
MAFWPRDQRTISSAPADSVKKQSRNYPNLEQGLIGAATLSEDRNKRLSWIFASKTPNSVHKSSQTQLKFGKEVQIRPPTHCTTSDSPRTSARQRAEQGANFLRTYIPDVEIPEELIRQQLIEDTTRSRELRKFDPYLGSLIDVFESRNKDDTIFAAFAAGETNQELRFTKIYCFDPSRSSQPPDNIMHTFSTPIQQIVSSDPPNNSGQDTNIAVRTYGSTKVLKVECRSSIVRPTVKESATFTRKSLDNETVVDMKYSSDGSNLMLMGDLGSVFAYNLFSDKQYKLSLPSGKDTPPALDKGNFWRLSLGTTPSDFVILSAKDVFCLDKRTNSSFNIFSLSKGKHVFTSVEDCHANNVLSLCSTDQVIWLDVRFPRSPLFAYAHGREYDQYLSTRTIHGSPCSQTTILTSRSNSMVTIYDASRSPSGLFSMNTVPYCLSSSRGMHQPHVGHQLIEKGNFTALLLLSEGAGVTYNELVFANPQAEHEHEVNKVNIAMTTSSTNGIVLADISPLCRQEFSQVDLQAAYEDMFSKHFAGVTQAEENGADSVSQLEQYFPPCVPSKPTGHLFTTHEIAILEGSNGDGPCENNFLADTPTNLKRAYRALKEGKLSPQSMKAHRHVSLLPVLQKFDHHLSDDPAKMEEYLQTFNLSNGEEISKQIRQYEEDASQQLILDLALSFDVLSQESPSKPGELDHALEVMTEALSLGDEPPPVEFGFLKPFDKTASVDDGNSDSPRGLDIPIGVRLLLQGWDTSDPETFVYHDSYNAANDAVPIKIKKSHSQSQSQVPVMNSQRPPVVLPSNVVGFSQLDILRKVAPKVQAHSQTAFAPLFELPDSTIAQSQVNESQEYMTSTQILPGPYGGRPTNVKKKAVKKRLGGF